MSRKIQCRDLTDEIIRAYSRGNGGGHQGIDGWRIAAHLRSCADCNRRHLIAYQEVASLWADAEPVGLVQRRKQR